MSCNVKVVWSFIVITYQPHFRKQNMKMDPLPAMKRKDNGSKQLNKKVDEFVGWTRK